MRFHILFGLVALCALQACDDLTYGRTLEGRVVNEGARFQTGTQKISLLIKATKSDTKIDHVAAGPSGVAVECLSTRCASIERGTCHRFDCKYVWRFMEPDVIACKHVKEVECSAPMDSTPSGPGGGLSHGQGSSL